MRNALPVFAIAAARRRLGGALVAALALGALPACQGPDLSYAPTLPSPTFPAAGPAPVVAVDTTHRNAHRRVAFERQGVPMPGTYLAFANLLHADGYEMRDFTTPYTADCNPLDLGSCAYGQALAALDTLVIANAQAPISAPEAAMIGGWVAAGGSLLLIADHPPFPQHVTELAATLGVDWYNEQVPITSFSWAAGSLADHAITRGREAAEETPQVETFTGSSLRPAAGGPGTATSLLDVVSGPQAGRSMGVALALGDGRVYASGEAAMFTNQRLWVIAGTPSVTPTQQANRQQRALELCGEGSTFEFCVATQCAPVNWLFDECFDPVCGVGTGLWECNERYGLLGPASWGPMLGAMSETPHNEQFLLNVMHWLSEVI
jgi:hypothetical protein